MWLERLSASSESLVPIEEARDHLRILDADSDGDITAASASAQAYLDVDEDGFGGLGFPLMSQRWILRVPSFADHMLRLPFARVSLVERIDYVAPDGSVAELDAGTYQLISSGRLRQIGLVTGASWPVVAERPDAVRITFSAGWADAASVPADIKAAAKLLIGHFFETRLAVSDGPSTEVQFGVDRLTARYRAFAI